MNCILVNGNKIQCKDITKEQIVTIPDGLELEKYDFVVGEGHYEFPMKTYIHNGNKYITEEAYRYWEMQNKIIGIGTNDEEEENVGKIYELIKRVRDEIWDTFIGK